MTTDKLTKLKKVLEKAARIEGSTPVALATEFVAIDDRISNLSQEVSDKLGGISDELKKKLDEELSYDIDPEEVRGEKGDKGDTGEKGADGKDGRDGKDGKKGDKGDDGKDGLDGLDGKDGKDGSPDTPEQVRDKLSTLKKDARLDVSAIKGIDNKKLSDEIVNRAIGIVDQRTSFLINKVSNLQTQVDNSAVVVDGVTITGSGTVGDPLVGAPSYTDEQAQDAVGNAVGTGLDYDDATGAISVDLTETTAVVTDPATQARNTIQPTADVTGMTLKRYYASATIVDPTTLSTSERIAHYIADDYVVTPFSWADASGNGYNLSAAGGGASKVLNVVNGHAVIRFTQQNHSFRNAAGFTLAQPFVVMMVVKSTYGGAQTPGSTWFAQGTAGTNTQVANYYEYSNGSPGWTPYAGTEWTPTDTYGTVGRFQVVVVKFDGASSYVRSGGNTNVVGNPGTNSLTGVTLGNNVVNLAGCAGDMAEVIILNAPSDATIAGVEAHLAQKYNLELESLAQQDDFLEFTSGVGESLLRITKAGTIQPTLFGAKSSALNVGVFSDAYPRWRYTPARIEIGDGTYDVMNQTGLFQKGWILNAPGTTNGDWGITSMSNYVSQVFQIRPPGNGMFSVNTGTGDLKHLGACVPYGTTYPAWRVKGAAGQIAQLQVWTNSSDVVLAQINKSGTALFKSGKFVGEATSVLTGTIDATASTTVTGVGTLFTTELVVGDRITVSGETRTVTAITDALNLTVDTAFTDTANDTSPDKLAAILVATNSAGAVKMVVNDLGNIGIGTTVPSCTLDVAGIVKTAGRRRAVTTKTDDYVATTADEVIVCNKATAMTITLPAATGLGQTFSISSIGVGAVTIDGNASETINGATSVIIYQYESITVVDYGTGVWTII